MTDTPITDADCWETLAGAMRCKPNVEHAYVTAKTARKLERETARLRGKLSLAQHNASGRWGDYERALSERDELRATLHAVHDLCTTAHETKESFIARVNHVLANTADEPHASKTINQ